MIKQIKNKEEFESEVLNGAKLCVIDFFASWCGPCQMLAPVVEEVSGIEDFKNTVNFYKVDIDGNEELATKYGIEVVPTLLFFKDGKVIKTEVGYKHKEELEKIIKKEA